MAWALAVFRELHLHVGWSYRNRKSANPAEFSQFFVSNFWNWWSIINDKDNCKYMFDDQLYVAISGYKLKFSQNLSNWFWQLMFFYLLSKRICCFESWANHFEKTPKTMEQCKPPKGLDTTVAPKCCREKGDPKQVVSVSSHLCVWCHSAMFLESRTCKCSRIINPFLVHESFQNLRLFKTLQ